MICKRAVWCTGSGADIANARSLITGLKHDLQTGVEDLFAKGRFGHKAHNTHERIISQKLFFHREKDRITSTDENGGQRWFWLLMHRLGALEKDGTKEA
jgi:hypothetical protein